MFDLAKEHYFEAQARRDRLRSTASLLVGIVTVLGSASAYLFDGYDFGTDNAFLQHVPPDFADGVFLTLIAVIGVCIIVNILLLVSLLSSRKRYEEVAALPDILSYKEEVEEYSKHKPHVDGETEFRRGLARRYARAAEKNRDNNISDLARIKWASLLCGIAGLLVLVSAVVYAGNRIDPRDIDSSKQSKELRHGRSKRSGYKSGEADSSTEQGNKGRRWTEPDQGREPREPKGPGG
jgi:hypothetical protein